MGALENMLAIEAAIEVASRDELCPSKLPGLAREELARLRRLAKIGAKFATRCQVVYTGLNTASSREACDACLRMCDSAKETLVHAHDCDAALYLGLEREAEK